ncbi:MAG: thiamine diphosphokinase [Tissierellia bacterium]|nr:thiamine diphosphokinase [Tissierellia bacterium]
MRRGLLVSGGQSVSKEILMPYQEDFILCADGGLRTLQKYGMIPDLVMGDMDSMDEKSFQYLKKHHIKTITYPREKDGTDTELCLWKFAEMGMEEVIIVNALGTRMDHSLANMYGLVYLKKKGIKGKILDDHNEIYYCEVGEYKFSQNDKKYISFLPVTEQMTYSSNGLRYETHHLTICRPYAGHGISNEILGQIAIITIEKGACFIMLTKD